MRHKANNTLMRAAGTLVLLASLISPTAYAQGVSVLTGTVNDAATHQPVSDVVVTATSPQLQGEQIVVTDTSGSYRIPQLPPGVYSIRFEKESYHPYTRGGIELRTDVTLRVNVDLLPETITQTQEVVVVGRPPTVDVGSSTTGVNVGSDFVKNIAVSRPGGVGGTSRSFEALAAVAPQTQGDAFGVSINGATSPENSYLIDGLSVNDTGFGTLGSPMTMEFVDDVNIITGGYMPEYGRSTGGTISATTKSGGNEFHGSFFGTLSPGSLQGPSTNIHSLGGSTDAISRNWYTGDVGVDVGGYIMKDKLWFFAGIQPSFSRTKTIRSLFVTSLTTDADGNIVPLENGAGVPVTTTIDDTKRSYFNDHKELQYIGKLTYLINQDHRLSLSVSGTPNEDTGPSRFLSGPTSNLVKLTSGSLDLIAKLSSSFMDKKLLLDISGGWHHQNANTETADGSALGSSSGIAGTPEVAWRADSLGTASGTHSIVDFAALDPAVTAAYQAACAAAAAQVAGADTSNSCPVTTFTTGGPGFLDTLTLNNFQYKFVATYLFSALGHHVAKVGTDGMFAQYNHTKGYSGGVLYREARNGSYFEDYREYGVLTAPDTATITPTQTADSKFNVIGGFLQDSWNIADLVTLNVGIRYDQENLVGYDGKSGFTLPNQWGPRVGLVYDPTQQGKSKFFANYARFYENVPLDAIDREFPGERQVSARRDATVCDPVNDPAGCRDPGTLIPRSGSSPNRFWGVTGGDQSLVDPNISAQSEDELVLGGEYEIIPNARAGVTYTRRYLVRVIEDMSNDEAITYFLGNPGYGVASTFPKAVRNYDAVTAYLSKNFADNWMAQASYTYSRVLGNYAGLASANNGQLDPNITSAFDLIDLLPNQTGILPADHRHALKVFAAKEFPLTGNLGINLGVTYQGFSGGALSYLGSQELYGPGEAFILPRGAAGRLPWQHTFDAHVGVDYRVSKDSTASLTVDTFNLFNAQSVAGVDQEYTNDDVLPVRVASNSLTPDQIRNALGNLQNVDTGGSAAPNPNFKNATAYQPARSVRFGVRVTF